MKKLLFIVSVFLFTNCASYHQLMVGPDGTIQDCNATGQGLIGMAVASSHTKGCADNLKKAGYIEIEKAGAIGIMFRSDSTFILKVIPKSPAEKAGIQPGDKITEIEGQRVYLPKDALTLLFGELNTQVQLVYQHGSETFKKTLIRASYIETFGTPKK